MVLVQQVENMGGIGTTGGGHGWYWYNRWRTRVVLVQQVKDTGGIGTTGGGHGWYWYNR